jgi:hypothetical protein
MKELIDKNEEVPKKEKTSCLDVFKCFQKKKVLARVDLSLGLKNMGLELRKSLLTFKKQLSSSTKTEEKVESFFTLSPFFTLILDNLNKKSNFLFEAKQLPDKLKDEVDNYWQYFNIKKIILKQESKIKHQKRKMESLEDAQTQNECIICMESERNVIFYPCLHLICCETCAFSKIGLDCPECFGKIESKQIALT